MSSSSHFYPSLFYWLAAVINKSAFLDASAPFQAFSIGTARFLLCASLLNA
jgi:uncharacterized membrane protein